MAFGYHTVIQITIFKIGVVQSAQLSEIQNDKTIWTYFIYVAILNHS
jgi:hypothetical protein